MKWLQRDLRTVVVAVVAAAVTAGAPALAHGVQHALFAHDADKVDGKHAVGAGATLNQAAGKLVASGGNGRIASKFIPTQFGAPRAFAAVDWSPIGFMSGQERRGFTGVTSPSTGVYCLALSASSGIDASSAIALATVEFNQSDAGGAFAEWKENSACPAGEIEFRTYSMVGGLVTLSNTIAFTVLVP